jgi:hypothetical protein
MGGCCGGFNISRARERRACITRANRHPSALLSAHCVRAPLANRARRGEEHKRLLPVGLSTQETNNKQQITSTYYGPQQVSESRTSKITYNRSAKYEHSYANSYNDGPPAPNAKPLGPFYELESSSPAAALAPGKSCSHVHRTIHITGPESALNGIALATLGVSIADIKNGLKPH